MSLNYIHDFRMAIYRLLSGDPDIRLKVDRIYLSIVQDGKYPFLTINLLKIDTILQYLQNIYQIEFEICVFARDKNQEILISLADKITNKLTADSCIIQDYIIAGINVCNINFQRSNDLITNKLTMNYKALLKGII